MLKSISLQYKFDDAFVVQAVVLCKVFGICDEKKEKKTPTKKFRNVR